MIESTNIIIEEKDAFEGYVTGYLYFTDMPPKLRDAFRLSRTINLDERAFDFEVKFHITRYDTIEIERFWVKRDFLEGSTLSVELVPYDVIEGGSETLANEIARAIDLPAHLAERVQAEAEHRVEQGYE